MNAIPAFTPGVWQWLEWAGLGLVACGSVVGFILWKSVSRDRKRRQ